MMLKAFFEKFDQLADAPDAVDRIRDLVLRLATTGHLVHTDESGWVTTTVGDIASVRMGKTILKNELSDSGIPVYSAGRENSAWGFIAESDLKFRTGTIVVSARGTIGFPKIPAESEFISTQTTIAITPKSADVGSGYLCLQLKTVNWDNFTARTAIPMITVKQVNTIEVRYPHSLAEQKRIVAKVDELMALCDRLEAQQQERDTRHAALVRASLARFTEAPTPANLQFLFHPSYEVSPADLRKTILTLAVQGKLVPQDPNDEPAEELFARIESTKKKLIEQRTIKRVTVEPNPCGDECGPLPPNWLWTRLGNAFDVRDGTHDTPKYTTEGFPLITSKNIYSGRLLFEGANFISEKDHRRISERSRVDRGDILFAMIGSIGNPVIVDTDREFSIKNVALFKYFSAVDSEPRFLLLYLKLVAEEMKAKAAGGVQAFVSLSFLRNYPFPLPPLAEQRWIVAKAEQLMSLVDELEQQLTACRATAEKLLTALVAELVNGKRNHASAEV